MDRQMHNDSIYSSSASMLSTLKEHLSRCIESALSSRGRALIALAGGATPFPIYHVLGALGHDWQNITIVPTDERWVDAIHAANNLTKLKQAFPSANFLPLVPEHVGQTPDAHFANGALAEHPELFDFVVLGMGADGHFASLFPGAEQLARGLADNAPDALVLHPRTLPPEAPFPRITLSLQRLLRTRRLMLWINGQKKHDVLRHARAGLDVDAMPIRACLQQHQCALDVHWSP
jgi:6-phosphogluconolactonase